MGASGYLAFENDAAADWLAELEDANDTSILVDAFDAVLDPGEDYMEMPEASTAIAAAEVVAALLGRAAMSLTEVIMDGVKGQSEVHPTVVEKARSAVNRVLDNSELQEVWGNSDNYSNWKMNVEDLLSRLV